jgi:uncharacterized protein YijF (DUF1287 family)
MMRHRVLAGLVFGAGAVATVQGETLADRLVASAIAQTTSRVTYDGSYRRIGYPGGDVPASVGVCTDVMLFAYPITGHFRYLTP